MVPNPYPTDKSVDPSSFLGSAPWTAHFTSSKSRLPAAFRLSFRLSLAASFELKTSILSAITEKPSTETPLESGTNFSLHDSFFFSPGAWRDRLRRPPPNLHWNSLQSATGVAASHRGDRAARLLSLVSRAGAAGQNPRS